MMDGDGQTQFSILTCDLSLFVRPESNSSLWPEGRRLPAFKMHAVFSSDNDTPDVCTVLVSAENRFMPLAKGFSSGNKIQVLLQHSVHGIPTYVE